MDEMADEVVVGFTITFGWFEVVGTGGSEGGEFGGRGGISDGGGADIAEGNGTLLP